MNLATRFLSDRRDRLLMRLGCCLVCFSLILCLMLPQQRVYAVEPLTMTAVSSLAGAYLGSCGLSLVASGMDSNGLASNIQRLIQEFLDTELGGISIQDWLVGVWDLSVIGGKLFMGRPLTNEFASFAQWVAGKYGTQAGVNVVYSDKTITTDDGTVYFLADVLGEPVSQPIVAYPQFSYGTNLIPLASGYTKDNPLELKFNGISCFVFMDNSDFCFGNSLSNIVRISSGLSSVAMLYLLNGELYISYVWHGSYYPSLKGFLVITSYYVVLSEPLVSNESFSLSRVLPQLYIPEGIDEEQGIALDVGAAETMDHDQVLQSVLDKILTGTLSPTMEIAGEAVVNPPAEEIADVEGLGLPALGTALTSRFPFSIPWDFFRAVQLLAAPAKAPYFEVDFMEPLADKVGGWQGSTKVVLDFGQYAIIGQISRWTSTIGFCLMLAGSTKRLIWTA